MPSQEKKKERNAAIADISRATATTHEVMEISAAA